MPYIATKTNVGLSGRKKQALKERFGQAIELIPGKSEDWLMLSIEDGLTMFFKGDDEPCAICQVQIFGTATEDDYAALTEKLAAANAALTEAQSALAEATSAKDAADATIVSLTEEKAQLEASIAELSQQLETVNARLLVAADCQTAADATIAELTDEKTKLEASLAELSAQLEAVNAQLRGVLRDHRGMSDLHRVKAVFWWCYMHTESPLPAAEILRIMPTDDDIEAIYQEKLQLPGRYDGPNEWGDGLVWSELHHSTPWRMDWD